VHPVAGKDPRGGRHFGPQQATDYSDTQSSPFGPTGHAARRTDPKPQIEE
jgi:hypothetical protein